MNLPDPSITPNLQNPPVNPVPPPVTNPPAQDPAPTSNPPQAPATALDAPLQPPVYSPSGPDKERLEIPSPKPAEAAPMLEQTHESESMPEEVEGWLEKLEQAHEIKLPEPVKHNGQVIVSDHSAQITNDRLVLPLSETAYHRGLKLKVNDSARWLSVWAGRLIKIFGGHTGFSH